MDTKVIKPPALKKGDMIGVMATSCWIEEQDLLKAKAAIEDRMVILFRNGLLARLRSMARRGLLRENADPDRTAHVVWEICHLRAWRSLVVDCGWTPEEFKASRLALISPFLRDET